MTFLFEIVFIVKIPAKDGAEDNSRDASITTEFVVELICCLTKAGFLV
jgi:hypothetical protein